MTTTTRVEPTATPEVDAAGQPRIATVPSPDLLEAIRAGARRADETATLIAAHDQMIVEGLFHLLVPPELGGAGVTMCDWFDVACAVSRVDPSAGWLMAQGAIQSAWIAVAGSDELVAEFFAAPQTLSSTSAGHVVAERRGTDHVVGNARWAYASGSPGAGYLGGMIITSSPDGAPETRMALVPAEDATIEPTWNTLGLRGTASNHVDFGDDVVIPQERTFTWPSLTIVRPSPLGAALRNTVWAIALSAGAVNLGAAQRSIDEAVIAAERKRHRFDADPVIHQAPFIGGVAELQGLVDVAHRGLRAMLDELWERAELRTEPDAEFRARLRLAAAAAVQIGADVVRLAQGLIGADSLHRGHVLEQLGRDTQMLLHHIAVGPPTRQQLGQVVLGTYEGPTGLI